jgi:hypothetical protein
MNYQARCHCGAIVAQVEAPETIVCEQCNCSICSKAGFLHLIVPAARFKLLRGQNQLSTYAFNTGVAKHYFCKVCGVKVFYIPRSNPDGFDVNVRCLEPQPKEIIIRAFDGQNWEANAARLAHLSVD